MSQNKASRTTVSHVFEGQLVVRFRGKACSIFFKAAAEKFKRRETLLEIEQRCHDGVVKGGKSVCLPRQSHFWCIKGETEDKDITDASVGDVCM